MQETSIDTIVNSLPRDLLIDLSDMAAAKASEAHKIIKNHTELEGKNARGAEGQIRFRTMEHGFQQICEKYGGLLVDGKTFGNANKRIYQPFMRFEKISDQVGVVIGLSSMPSKRELPTKNKSRLTGVSLNYDLIPRLGLTPNDPKLGDIFVLFLVSRDPKKAGQINEVAIGVIDSEYESYIFYESVEKFMARYTPEEPQDPKAQEPLVKLKKQSTLFIPPEENFDNNEDEDESS